MENSGNLALLPSPYIKGNVTKLSSQVGTNNAIWSKGMKYYMNVYSNIDTPPVTTLCDANGKVLKTL